MTLKYSFWFECGIWWFVTFFFCPLLIFGRPLHHQTCRSTSSFYAPSTKSNQNLSYLDDHWRQTSPPTPETELYLSLINIKKWRGSYRLISLSLWWWKGWGGVWVWGAEGERWVSDSVQGEHRVSRHEESGHLPWVGSVLKCVCVCVRQTNWWADVLTNSLPPYCQPLPPPPPVSQTMEAENFNIRLNQCFPHWGQSSSGPLSSSGR